MIDVENLAAAMGDLMTNVVATWLPAREAPRQR